MPRRSARIKHNDEQKDVEMDEVPTVTTNNKRKKREESTQKTAIKESVSNDSSDQSDNDTIQIEEKEQSLSMESSVDVTNDVRRLSIDQNTVLPPPLSTKHNDVEMEDIAEEEANSDDEPRKTLAQTRSRRNQAKISYKDESSDDNMLSDSDGDDDDEDPLFNGLSKEEKAELRSKMDGIQAAYNESVRKERQLKLQEIICSFDFNIGAEVTIEEAGFIYDFTQKHQFDVNDKIEDEGDFFLCSMREMMEEKMKLIRAGFRTKSNHNKRRANDSDSEFEFNDYDDSDSEYSVDSDWDNPDIDNENMISDDDEYAYKKKKRRNKNVWIDKDGREYRCAGRLLLDDALKDTENFEGWSAARVKAWKNKAVNPNAYYYRFNDPGEGQKNGRIGMDEHKVFMERVMECGVNVHWGSFSMKIPGRVGYQCSNYWRQMMKDGWVKDPNYWIRSDASFQFKRAKKGSIPDGVRKYSFVIIKDPSKVFDPLPGHHPKRPSDKQLTKYLQQDVKALTNKEKKGKKSKGKKKNEENTNNKEEVDTDNKEEVDTDNKENVEEKKKGKKKKKKKEDAEEEEEEEEGVSQEGKKKKKKKKKSKKDKKDKKKDKKKKKKKKDKKKKKKNKTEDGEMENEGEKETNDNDNDNENENDNDTKNIKKRKRFEDGEASEHEPPQKKRKVSANKSVLDGVDIMTGEKLVNPAMSPYGHVMEYSSWCSILRNPLTKNKCPFTQKALTRRSLIKLDKDNIEEYKDKIVNITDQDMNKLLK